jgi:integral membrane protein (TIGR01906 family)
MATTMMFIEKMELSEETKKQIEKSRKEIVAGKFYTHEQVKKKFGFSNGKMKHVFAVLFVIFVLLLSYQIAAFGREYSSEQQGVVDYVQGDGVLEGFTDAEVSHLDDVKDVMFWVDVLLWVIGLLLVILGYLLYRHEMLYAGLLYGGYGAVGFVVVVGLFGLLSFGTLFSGFHSLFFAPGTWTFSPDSLLIMLFPLEFFMDVTKDILMLTGLFGVVSVVVGKKR